MSKLFSVDTSLIGWPEGPAMSDALPENLLYGTPRTLRDDLELLVGPDALVKQARQGSSQRRRSHALF
jgi:hypothetical protein